MARWWTAASATHVHEFKVFAAAAFAGVEGKIPRSITSRAIVMHIHRRSADEQIEEFRERAADDGIVKLSEVGAVANHISLMRHI